MYPQAAARAGERAGRRSIGGKATLIFIYFFYFFWGERSWDGNVMCSHVHPCRVRCLHHSIQSHFTSSKQRFPLGVRKS